MSSDNKKAIKKQSIEWITILHGSELNPQTQKAFESWIEAPENANVFQQTYREWQALASVTDLQEAATHNKASNGRSWGDNRWVGLMAAAAVIVLSIFLWPVSNETDIAIQKHETLVGEHKVISLSDGSEISLSGNTRLWVRMSDTERHIQLLSGSAYFDVKKDKSRPFIVRQSDLSVKVVGTAFEVRTGRSGKRVQVAEGIVNVESKIDGSIISQKLVAGQQIESDITGKLSEIKEIDAKQTSDWRHGRLNYVDTSLASIVDDINRYRQHKILLASESLGKTRLTLSLQTDGSEKLLELLSSSRLASIVRQGNSVILDQPNDH